MFFSFSDRHLLVLSPPVSSSISAFLCHTSGITYRAGTPRAHQSGPRIGGQDAGEHPRSANVSGTVFITAILSLPPVGDVRARHIHNRLFSAHDVCQHVIAHRHENEMHLPCKIEKFLLMLLVRKMKHVITQQFICLNPDRVLFHVVKHKIPSRL